MIQDGSQFSLKVKFEYFFSVQEIFYQLLSSAKGIYTNLKHVCVKKIFKTKRN